MTDIRQSPYWSEFMKELGWGVEKIGKKDQKQFVFLKKIPLLGTVLKSPRIATPIPFTEIDELAQESKAAFAKIEPNHTSSDKSLFAALAQNSFLPERWSLHPTKTIIIDLRKGENELLANMEHDTRYSIRASQRRGVRVVKSSDLERFLKLYRQTAKRQRFWIAEAELRLLWEIFSNEGKAFILIAQWNKADIAGCLILHYDKKAYYYHAASIRHLGELFAPYLLVWEAMLKSKALKLKELDLEGIYDPRIPTTSKWRGFSHFKKGFRGEEVELAGSFVKTYNPLAKLLFKFGNFSF